MQHLYKLTKSKKFRTLPALYQQFIKTLINVKGGQTIIPLTFLDIMGQSEHTNKRKIHIV